MKKDKPFPRKSEISTVGQAIDDLMKNFNIKNKYDEVRLIDSWERLMGKPIASRTSRIFVRGKVLFVELQSAPLKHELSMSKGKIIEIFDKEIGKGIVTEVVFL